MSKEIITNHSHHETRVALMEDGMLTELQYEREREQRIVGNIYKGRVVKVLPGMESAFIDIGACLLYTSPSPRDRTRSRMPSSA